MCVSGFIRHLHLFIYGALSDLRCLAYPINMFRKFGLRACLRKKTVILFFFQAVIYVRNKRPVFWFFLEIVVFPHFYVLGGVIAVFQIGRDEAPLLVEDFFYFILGHIGCILHDSLIAMEADVKPAILKKIF